ncbi:MAG: GTP cyclohydrolase I FolE [Anaerolineales bacterium]|jgi:GTP cyclohydrolase I
MEDRKSIGDIIWLNDVGVEENYGFGDNDYGSISDPDESEKLENIESAVRLILSNVNEDPDRQGLIGTPNRIARMYSEILGGYSVDLGKLVNGALFDVTYDEMIVVKDIEFYSMCEHHMLPFFGKAHVAYIPSNKVIGLSKIPRIVEMFSRRLQVQERMTRQIADTIDEILDPQGVAVIVEGSHMCSMMRGVKKQEASMITSAMLGSFKTNEKTRNEFLSHVRGN